MNSCKIIPTIKVGQEEVESKLFKDLLEYGRGDRKFANYIWGLTRVPEFISSLQGIVRDSNGEPTINSLVKAMDLKGILKGNTSLSIEKKELGAVDDNNKPIVHKSINSIITKVIDYNRSNQDLVADIHKVEGGYTISLDRKNNDNSEVPNNLMFKNALNNQLLGIVRRLGFDVKVDDKSTYDGIFDPTNAEYTSDGLRTVIRIAKGEVGENAFPEEFSHLIISGLRREPLVSRLLNSLSDTQVISEILGNEFDKYYTKYNGNIDLLTQEAAAKLLYRHITNPKEPTSNIISRLWQWVKNKFSKVKESDIDIAIQNANQGFAKLASRIKDESILESIDTEAISKSPTLYKINSEVGKLEELANSALEVASKRLKILQARSKNGKYEKEDVNSIKNLQSLIDKKKYSKSCYVFLNDSLSQIESINKELNRLLKKDARGDSNLGKIKRIASILRNIKEFSDGYEPIIRQMMTMKSMQEAGEINISEEDAEQISNKALEIFGIINNINARYKSLRFNTVYNFLKIYWGEDKIATLGKNKGDVITLEELLKMANKDINGIDRWITSMSDTSDPLLSIIDKVVKVSKAQRDAVLEDVVIELREAHNKLSNAGYDESFMYERDSNGKLTGRIISDYDFERFNKEREEYKQSLIKEGKKPFYVQTKLEAWERKHLKPVVVDAETGAQELLPIYTKDVLSTLAPAQREYYDSMIKAKAVLESMIPSRYTNLYNAVQIRNNMVTALADNASSPKEASKLILENLKDNFIRRSDDSEYGDSSNILLDFSGKPVDRLPIYYTRPLEDVDRLSLDFTSSMMAYAGMAINYSEMNKIVDALELTRSLVKEREIQQYSGDHKLREAFTVVNKKFNKHYTKPGANSNIGERLDDYFDAVVYNRLKKDQGSFKMFGNEVDTAKTLDSIKSYTGVIGLGLNVFSGISNITSGNIQMVIEAVGGEYFGLKNWIKAKKNYYSLLPKYLSELNSTTKTSKLGLLIDKFDVMEDFYNSLKEQGKFKGPLARILGQTSVFMLNNLGEHYLHSVPMLSILDNYKVKYKGEEISLFDAFDVEEVRDTDGTVLSAKLKIKEGITKLDGSILEDSDIVNLKLKISKVNQSLNGAFSDEDKGAIHRGALGRMAMQFRQWMPAHYNRRFAGAYYDAQMDQWREGYYRTLGSFSLNLARDLVRLKFELATHWDELSEHEKANIRRALTEIGIFAELTALIAMAGPEKDRKGVWLERMVIYNLNRMKLEVGASIPSLDFLDNAWTILQSPAASIKTVNNILDIFKFQNMFVELQSGRYKGWTEYQRDLVELIPLYGQLNKVVDITEEDYMFKIFE